MVTPGLAVPAVVLAAALSAIAIANHGPRGDASQRSAEVRRTSPDPFRFIPLYDVVPGKQVTFRSVRITGIGEPVPIAVAGGEYRVNDEPWTAEPGVVKQGDLVRVRHRSAATSGTAVNTRVTIGDQSGTFTSVTEYPLSLANR